MRFAVLWNDLPQMGHVLSSDIAIPPPPTAFSTPPDGGSDDGRNDGDGGQVRDDVPHG